MKKILATVLALALCFALVGCGSSTPAPSTNVNAPAENAEQQSQPASTPEPAASVEDVAFEIINTSAVTWVNSIGRPWVQVIIEIENTGTSNLYLSSGSYDLETSDGSLVASRTMVNAYPQILAPGEKGCYYEETTLDEVVEGDLVVIPRPSIDKAKTSLIRYDVEDVTLKNDDYYGVKALGRVSNTADEDGNLIYITMILYGEDGKCIGSMFTILTDTLKAGDKVGFELSGFSLPDGVTADSVASYQVYAYPNQYQF